MKDDITTVRSIIEEVLASDPRARADDKWLSFQTLKRMGFSIFVDFNEISSMPAFESISRARRKLQQEGKYLPPKEVEKERRDEEKKMKNIDGWWH